MQLITSRGIHPWAALKSQLMRKFSVITFMCIIFAFDPLTHAIELHNSFSIGQKCKWISHFRVSCAFISKRVLVQNHSYENVFDLHENETACRTHFHVKGFAFRLVWKQRRKRTRKWPIAKYCITIWIKTGSYFFTQGKNFYSSFYSYSKPCVKLYKKKQESNVEFLVTLRRFST